MNSPRRPRSPAMDNAFAAFNMLKTPAPDKPENDSLLQSMRCHLWLAKESLALAEHAEASARSARLAQLRIVEEWKVSIELREKALGVDYSDRTIDEDGPWEAA